VNRIEPRLARRLRRLSLGSAIFAATLATIALVGWALNWPRLTTLFVGLAAMKVNTAVALLACAGALVLRNLFPHQIIGRRAGDALAMLSLTLGALTLVEYATGHNLGIDSLLYNDTFTPPHGHPGRMSIATAAGLSLVALATFMLDRQIRAAQAMSIAALLIAMLGLLGYAYGFDTLSRIGIYSSMALNTAMSISLCSAAVLTARPRQALHHLLINHSPGGSLSRHLLPATILIPLVVGRLVLQGQRLGLYSVEFTLALFALSTIVVLASMVWWNALLLDRTDIKRHRSEADRDDLLHREQVARARAERALLARDQLLAIVSHELRTPLTPALLTATALKNRANLPPDVMDDLQIIHEQIEIEARLINDLLDMAGLNQGKLSLALQTVDVRDVARAASAAFSQRFTERNIHFMLELHSKQPCVNADPLRLKQILNNLVDNAVKFTPDGGCIRLRIADIERDGVSIEITDSGVGLEPGAIDRIFDAFEQADLSTTRRFGGLGVGLTISKLLVELHGGKLTASSDGVNRGSKFTIHLPRLAPVADLPPVVAPPPKASAPPRKLTILLVDDNPQTVMAMERILRLRGFDVLTATSATQALDVARHHSFDLLISDIGLPDLSGWELMRQLREIRPVVGIALSGFVEPDDIAKSLEAGYRLHLGKPLDLQKLLGAIQSVTAKPGSDDAVERTPHITASS